MNEIRLLGKDDIEIRVAQTTEKDRVVKASLLLYKNARVDMKIMDELFGPFGWKRSHKLLGDRLYCVVEVWDTEKKEWVSKEDVGVESNTEAEKGQASDSFKRACVNWGIGRELYTAPRITIELGEKEYGKMQNGSIRVWQSFRVSEIEYNKEERTITKLVVVDRFDNVRFEYANGGEKKPATKRTTKKADTPAPAEEAKPQPELPPATTPHEQWVKAIATHAVNKAGIRAEDAYIEKFHPTDEEYKKMMDDVFRYQIKHGLSD